MNPVRAHVWALFGVVALVSACGGGGDSGSSSPPASSPPPAQEEFLVAGFGPEGQATRMVVADPAQPSPVRLSTLVDQHLEATLATFDASGRRTTLGRDSAVYYLRQGMLYQVSLRKSQSQVPRRLSALATACSVDDWHPLSFNGDEGWLEITASGGDGDCFATADNRKAFIRHNATATDVPTTVPVGVQILASLPDPATQALVGFVAVDARTMPTKLSLYSPALAYVGDVAGSLGRGSLEILSFRPGGSLTTSAYVKAGSLLGRLDWSSASATLTPFHSYTGATSNDEVLAHSDSTSMYFLDGLSLLRIDLAGIVSTLATLSAADGTEIGLRGLTSGHVVVQQSSGGSSPQVFTVPKLGGPPLRLAPAMGSKYVIGVRGDEVIYSTYPGVGTRVLRRVGADGNNDQQIAFLNSGFPMPVSNPSFPHQTLGTLDAVMWCDVPAGQGHCMNGSLRSYDVQSRTTVTMGTLAHTGSGLNSSLYVSGWGFSDRPSVISATASAITPPGFVSEFYLVQPGTANSLVRLTSNIP